MKITSTLVTPHSKLATATPKVPSRRNWLKGLGAVLGSGLLAAPTAVLAAPASTTTALAGGDEYIGMVKLLTGRTVPPGWALCDGRELAVAQHPALFAVLQAVYGGDGRHTFALPDLRADMAAMAARAPNRPAGAVPLGQLCAIKIANAPATTTAVAELRLEHLHRPRLARGQRITA